MTNKSTEITAEDRRRGHTEIIENLPVAGERWVDENYVHHDPLTPETETVSSLEQYLAAYEAFKTAVPDQVSTAEKVIVEGNWSAARWHFIGTHTGQFRDIAPSNNKIDYVGMTMYRWEGSKVVEGWTLFDVVNFSRQIGIGPQQ